MFRSSSPPPTDPRRRAARRRVALVVLSMTMVACSASRSHYPSTTIDSCDYCVITEEKTYGYFDDAWAILGESFIMLEEDDPRLRLREVRQSACMASIDWSRGFWSTTAWVDVKDYETKADILQSYIRRGALYSGVHGDVIDVLKDVAAARAAGPPLPEPAEIPPGVSVDQPASGSIEARLSELKQLYDRGLIDRGEYDERRQAILKEL